MKKEVQEEEAEAPVKIFSERREMDTVTIELEDIKKAVHKLKNGKAAGTDGVVGELIKYGGETLHDALHNLYTAVLEEGVIPQDWKKSRVTLIHKGGGKAK